MKKKLESELVSIAHRILKLKGKEDVIKMHAEVVALHEKISVLKFAHQNFEGDLPTIGNDSSFFGMLDQAFNNKVSDNIEIEDKIYINLDEVEDDNIMEPAIEKIKDMVAQMPQEAQDIDVILKDVLPAQSNQENELEELVADFQEMPVFEKVNDTNKNGDKKTLNDSLKSGGISIGLNDKIAFIKHLFDGKSEDYERVLSQLNTANSYTDATQLIQNIVKPDYNDWQGKEEFEERFLELIESKFS